MGFWENLNNKAQKWKEDHDIAYIEAEDRARWMSDEELIKEIRSHSSFSWKNAGALKAYRAEWERRHGH